jgi:hypothetical protein
MSYEINVAMLQGTLGWDGKPVYNHLFATHDRSIVSRRELRRVLEVFLEKFPGPQFLLSVTLWHKEGQIQEMESLREWIAKGGETL